jgi:hypothetical protein
LPDDVDSIHVNMGYRVESIFSKTKEIENIAEIGIFKMSDVTGSLEANNWSFHTESSEEGIDSMRDLMSNFSVSLH